LDTGVDGCSNLADKVLAKVRDEWVIQKPPPRAVRQALSECPSIGNRDVSRDAVRKPPRECGSLIGDGDAGSDFRE
jgi:hypothetical protein